MSTTTTYTGTDWAFDWYMDLERKRRIARSQGDESTEADLINWMGIVWIDMSKEQRKRASKEVDIYTPSAENQHGAT